MPKGKAKTKESKPIEQTLWDAANKLRGKVEPAEYKHVVLSMIFLKYANDRFNEHRKQMIADGQQAFLEMMPFYTKDNVFYIPECARWSFIMENAKQPDIAIKIDTALHEIEMKNPTLAGALPDNYYSRLHMDPSGLSSLLDLINGIELQVGGDKDIFGKVYEYCLRQFALKEGKGKGEFYTPRTVVALLCELIEPYHGIVYDGACGSGGMFIQSMRFVDEHRGNRLNVSIYGQELTDTTRRLAKMNLAIRGISANLGAEAANTFLNDQESKSFTHYYDKNYAAYDRYGDDRKHFGLHWGNTVAALRWNHVFGGRLFSNTSASLTRYQVRMASESEARVDDSGYRTSVYSSSEFLSGIPDLALRTDFEYTPSAAHAIRGRIPPRCRALPLRRGVRARL